MNYFNFDFDKAYRELFDKAYRELLDIVNKQRQELQKVSKNSDACTDASKESKKLDFSTASHVRKMLTDIPKDLRSLFTPKTPEELEELEFRLVRFSQKEKVRDDVMTIQKRFNLLLRPNMSLHRVAILVRISDLRKSNQKKYGDRGYRDSGPGADSAV